MISEEEFLKGNWWLVTAKYPVACDASINEVIESEEDPTLESSYARELIEECGEEDQFEDWYEQQREGVELEARKIDEDVIDEYGVEWLNDYLA